MRPTPTTGRRGQAMVLFCLTLVLIVLMACITLSIATRTRERLEQQTLADTIAYSNAVASARAYNTLSLINRTALSHWVSLMAVQANVAWSSLHKAWFESMADALGELDPPGGPQGNGCGALRQKQIKYARHSLLHAALSSYNGPNANDNVDMSRGHDPVDECTLVDERLPGRNFGKDDLDVAQESRKIYDAINDLTLIQEDIYKELEGRVRSGQIGTELEKLARGNGATAPYRTLAGGGQTGYGPAWDQVSHALGREVPDDVRRRSLVPLAHAAMGSRPSEYLVGGSDQDNPPANSNRVKPPWTMAMMQKVQADLNLHFNGTPFLFRVEHFAVRTYLQDEPLTIPSVGRVHPGRDLGFGNVGGGAWARIRLEYQDPCTGGGPPRKKWVYPEAELMLNRLGTSIHEFGHKNAGEGKGTAAHQAKYGNVCHPDHRHWGEIDSDKHYLPGLPNESIWPGGFGFVFPQGKTDERNFPLFGQPRMPTFLARSYRPADARPDPWNLTRRMGLTGGSTIDLRPDKVAPDQAAISTAILYYHRRRANGAGRGDPDRRGTTGWRESPNLLNPYWHATLVRGDLGDFGTQTRDDPLPATDRTEYRMLRAEGFNAAADAYLELNAAGFKSWQ